MKYDAIIIGGGAAGLFCAASTQINNGLILEKSQAPGRKLLMSGAGQCNLTHGGSIKDFITHYGPNGKKIRSALYKVSNLQMCDFFQSHGVPMMERDDGKIFPESLRASHVLNTLQHLSAQNGWKLQTSSPCNSIQLQQDGSFLINGSLQAAKVIVACGGCSIPTTGSDGSIFPQLEALGLEIVPPAPALVPLTVQEYPYTQLAGISFKDALVTITTPADKPAAQPAEAAAPKPIHEKLIDDVLLTHSNFSGPAILNLSRYAKPGSTLVINYLGREEKLDVPSAEKKNVLFWLADWFDLPKRFVETILNRAGVDPATKANQLTKKQKQAISALLMGDTFSVSGSTGFKNAMVTRGGVALSQVDLKTFECKAIPGLHIIGETLDVDGDTGGYNLQFAFSSAVCCGSNL